MEITAERVAELVGKVLAELQSSGAVAQTHTCKCGGHEEGHSCTCGGHGGGHGEGHTCKCGKGKERGEVPVGVSNRHIHLSHADVETLFGAGYKLTPLKELSQPGQYACKECLTIVGPSMRSIENVRVLGPERKKSQVEISRTDSFQLKVKPPVRESGDLAGSAPVTVIGPKGVVTLSEGCIIANRHIHMHTSDGASFGVKDGDYVTVEVAGERRTTWYDVQVRVHENFRLEMHVDTDDANAAGIGNGTKVKVLV